MTTKTLGQIDIVLRRMSELNILLRSETRKPKIKELKDLILINERMLIALEAHYYGYGFKLKMGEPSPKEMPVLKTLYLPMAKDD